MTAAERAAAWRRVPGNIEREKRTKAAFKVANPEKWKQQKRAKNSRYNSANIIVIRAKAREGRMQLRQKVFAAYGCRCNCSGCHVHHAELLTVDHVHGDGAEHRKRIGRSVRDLYADIVRQNFPPDYQLLCGSCNLAKGTGTSCPLAGKEH